jgi:signal transduction histidine kinase
MEIAFSRRLRTAEGASVVRRARAALTGLSLATRFLLANLVVFAIATVILGSWIGSQIEVSVLNRTAGVTALYVDSVVSPQLQNLTTAKSLDASAISALDQLLTQTQFAERIVALKVWGPDGTILYSPNRDLIGRAFPVEGGLAKSVAGEVSAEITGLQGVENVYERGRWTRLVEVYAPVFKDHGGPLIAVAEFYQLPDALESEVRSAQLGSWAVVGLTMLAAYLLLAGIVRTGSDTIGRQSRALRDRVQELQTVIGENRRLQGRVASAVRSGAVLNEQLLRRISADLHDGPAQALGLALLRLDELPPAEGVPSSDIATVRQSVADALVELRVIAAGLRSPELERYTLAQIVERVAKDHERRSGTRSEVSVERLPDRAPLAIKIALNRVLQEALSNATRHGRAATASIHLWVDTGVLNLTIQDDGAGFLTETAAYGLGIAGMRERAEVLGGSFAISSRLGVGTTIMITLPLQEVIDG